MRTTTRTIKIEAPKKQCLTLADIESFIKDARAAGATGVEEISGSTTAWGMKIGEISLNISSAREGAEAGERSFQPNRADGNTGGE